MILWLFTVLVASASFSFVSDDESDDLIYEYPSYVGNMDILKRVVRLSGSLAQGFSREAKCIDDILTDEHLTSLFTSLNGTEGLVALGKLLSEMNPKRFDALCSSFDGLKWDVEMMVKGYANGDSLWKKSFELAKDAPVTYENAPYHRGGSAEQCAMLMDRPEQILLKSVWLACSKLWDEQRRPDLLRRMLHSPGTFTYRITNAFRGHEDELVEKFTKSLMPYPFDYHLNSFTVRVSSFDLEHWKQVRDILRTNQATSFLPSFNVTGFNIDPEIAKVVVDINDLAKFGPRSTRIGVDVETFEGEHPVARKLTRHQQKVYDEWYSNYPARLSESLNWAHLNLKRFDNSLLIVTEFFPADAKERITTDIWAWFANLYIFSGLKPRMEKIRLIFAAVKDHLIRLPTPEETVKIEKNWSLLPILQEMVMSPSLYFSVDLCKQGLNWASSVVATIPAEENSAIVAYTKEQNAFLIPLAFDQGWLNAIKETLSHEDWKSPHIYLGHDALSIFLRFLDPSTLMDKVGDVLRRDLRIALLWIAQTSNYKLLDCYLEFFQPYYILSLLRDDDDVLLRRRITLMLHLSYKTTSYQIETDPINKNSVFFRDWVMARLPSNHLADRKLLHYYFINRSLGRYPNFDVMSGFRVLGLFGDHHDEHDFLRAENLLFHPPNSESAKHQDTRQPLGQN